MPEQQSNPVKVALVVVLGSFMMVLDGTVMNVALPALQGYFGGGTVAYSTVAWVITGYSLAQACAIPLTDWCARRIGTKRLYLCAIAAFSLISAACAAAPSLGLLVTLRVLQGFSGACVMPLGTSMIARASGPARLGRMMSIMGVPMMLAPVIGPIVGGWILDIATWHWIFLINVPVGLLGVLAGLIVLPKDSASEEIPMDSLGVMLMCPGLALALWGTSNLGTKGSIAEPSVALPLAIAVIFVGCFIFRSLRIRYPLLDLSVMRVTEFRRTLAVMITYQMAFFGALLIIPAYLQQVRGMSSLEAGLLMAPSGIGAMLTMPIASGLVDRFPIGRIAPFGVGILALSMLGLTAVRADTPGWVLVALMFVQGLGLGSTMMPTATAAIKPIQVDKITNANTIWNILQQTASAAGVAAVSVVLSLRVAARPGVSGVIGQGGAGGDSDAYVQAAAAFGETFWLPTILLGIGFILALRLPRKAGELELGI